MDIIFLTSSFQIEKFDFESFEIKIIGSNSSYGQNSNFPGDRTDAGRIDGGRLCGDASIRVHVCHSGFSLDETSVEHGVQIRWGQNRTSADILNNGIRRDQCCKSWYYSKHAHHPVTIYSRNFARANSTCLTSKRRGKRNSPILI